MDRFELIADLGITFAGFTGIFLVLARRSGRFSAREAMSIQLIVIDSLFAAFLSLVPLGLALFEVADSLIWRICSASYVAAAIPVYVYIERRFERIAKPERPAHMSIQYFFGKYSTILIAVAQIPNIVGWPYGPGPGTFFVGVAVALGLAAMVFVGFLFSRLL